MIRTRLVTSGVVLAAALGGSACSGEPRAARASALTPPTTEPAPTPRPAPAPWLAARLDRPGALLDAVDAGRGEPSGTLARALLAGTRRTDDAPLRMWLAGASTSPSVWLAGPTLDAAPGADDVGCDRAAHVCTHPAAELPFAVAFAASSPGASAQAASPWPAARGPFIEAHLDHDGVSRGLPPLVARLAGTLATVSEIGGRLKNTDPAVIRGLTSGLRDGAAVEATVRDAFADVRAADVRLTAMAGGYVGVDLDLEIDAGGASGLAKLIAKGEALEDGPPLGPLARRCPTPASVVIGMHTPPGANGAPGVPAAMLLTELAGTIPDAPLAGALRRLWAATSHANVTCQAAAADGTFVSLGVMALRDPKAAEAALKSATPFRKGGSARLEQTRTPAGTVVLEMALAGAAPQRIGVAVIGDVLVVALAPDAGKRLDALRLAKLPQEPPLVGGLEAAPAFFGIDVARSIHVEGEATVTAQLGARRPGHLRGDLVISPGAIHLIGDIARAVALTR